MTKNEFHQVAQLHLNNKGTLIRATMHFQIRFVAHNYKSSHALTFCMGHVTTRPLQVKCFGCTLKTLIFYVPFM